MMKGPEDIPEDLRNNLTEALHKIALFVHENALYSNVIIHALHISDALERSGGSEIMVGFGGVPIKTGNDGPTEKIDPAKMAEDMVTQMMAKAKAKSEPK